MRGIINEDYKKDFHDKRYGHTDIIGIRDGTIVNAFGNPAIEPLHYFVYGKPPYKAGDSIYNLNLWDAGAESR